MFGGNSSFNLAENDQKHSINFSLTSSNSLRKIWCNLLGHTPDKNKDFRMAGGSSILAGTLSACIRSKFEIELDIQEVRQRSLFLPIIFIEVYQNRTIEAQAELVKSRLGSQQKQRLPRVPFHEADSNTWSIMSQQGLSGIFAKLIAMLVDISRLYCFIGLESGSSNL